MLNLPFKPASIFTSLHCSPVIFLCACNSAVHAGSPPVVILNLILHFAKWTMFQRGKNWECYKLASKDYAGTAKVPLCFSVLAIVVYASMLAYTMFQATVQVILVSLFTRQSVIVVGNCSAKTCRKLLSHSSRPSSHQLC